MSVEDFFAALREAEPWRVHARCLGVGPEKFFPKRGDSQREAKEMCMACPVSAQCGDAADQRNEQFGIWNGKIRRRTSESGLQPLHLRTDTVALSSPASEQEGAVDPQDHECLVGSRIRELPRAVEGRIHGKGTAALW